MVSPKGVSENEASSGEAQIIPRLTRVPLKTEIKTVRLMLAIEVTQAQAASGLRSREAAAGSRLGGPSGKFVAGAWP
jgi:hypothetical protein